MKCAVYALNALKSYKYVVILSEYRGKIVLSKHRERATWETQGGHIEPGETPMEAAKRELFEESGAVRFTIAPVCDYWAADERTCANGMVFIAHIEELGNLPDSEMAQVALFDQLPGALTYPEITPMLFAQAGQLLGVTRENNEDAGTTNRKR